MARFFPRLRGRPQRSLAILFALPLGLMACDGPVYPPSAACAGCGASAPVRAEMARGGGWSGDVEEPRTQRALTRSQVASRSVRLPLLSGPERDARRPDRAPGDEAREIEQTAAPASPVALARGSLAVTLVYASAADRLTIEMKNRLRVLAFALRRDGALRIELMGFARAEGGTATRARHIALKRAMGVRDYLIEQDVDLGRIDVKAMGARATGGPFDRVDIVVAPVSHRRS